MSKYFSLACIALSLLSVAVCCEPVEITPQVTSTSQAPFLVEISTGLRSSTKSSMSVSEDDIHDINIYAYRGGLLEDEAYGKGTAVSLTLFPDKEYTIYALANVGEVHAPASESQLGQICVGPDKMAMCCREGRTKTFTRSDRSLQLELSRLYARYELELDDALKNCSYTVTSVEIVNHANSVFPFSGASAASGTSRGDHASIEDLSRLNSGEKVHFYVLENCQGVLLPGNTDPWKKCPENIPTAKRDLCTYMHIEGTWKTEGATADMSINLMLGSDNCTDFNVVRNTAVSITLTLEDSGTLRSNWKVDLDSFEDERNLSFVSSEAVVMQGDGWVSIPLNVQPSDMTFYASVSSPEVFDYKVENGKVYVKGLYDGDERPEATLEVSSWDYRHRSSVDLTLDYNYTPIPDLEVGLPKYYGEFACVSLPEASDETPVVVETAGHKAVFAPSGKRGWEQWIDEDVEYYALYDENMLVFRSVESSVSSSFSITKHKGRNTYYLSTTLPALHIDDGLVSEAGNREYDGNMNLYYDSIAELFLCDKDGSKLDMSIFKEPDVLVSSGALSISEPYESFRALYKRPVFSANEEEILGYEEIGYGSNGGTYIAENNKLAKLYLYGIGEYPDGGWQYGFNAEIPLACGESITANSVIEAIDAFPDQRYLGNVFNYQLATGDMCSYSASIDFSSGGNYLTPSINTTMWSILHMGSSGDHLSPESAFSTSKSDAYSKGVEMSGFDLNFTELDSDNYPACGAMALKGTVVNPHNRRFFLGYYTFDLVLYLPIGSYVDFPTSSGGKLCVGFAPFVDRSADASWRSYFPKGIKVKSKYDDNLYTISMPGNNLISEALIVAGYDPANSLDAAISQLTGKTSLFEFEFEFDFDFSKPSVSLNRPGLGPIIPTDDILVDRDFASPLYDGSWGYYYLVKQYTHPTFDHGNKYKGLDNYIIEAAYENISL